MGWLCLKRRTKEGITLEVGSTRINVVVSEADGGAAVLAVNAPKEVAILRDELLTEEDRR